MTWLVGGVGDAKTKKEKSAVRKGKVRSNKEVRRSEEGRLQREIMMDSDVGSFLVYFPLNTEIHPPLLPPFRRNWRKCQVMEAREFWFHR